MRDSWRQRGRLVVGLLAISTVATGALVGTPIDDTPTAVAETVPTTVSGRVFIDTALDGRSDPADTGRADVAVRAFDHAGVEVGSATTSATGEYSITLATAHTGSLRIEFDTPSGYVSALVTGVEGGSGSSIRFVDPGATDVDYGIMDPASACALSIAHVCMRQGPLTENSADRVVGISPFTPPATSANPPIAAGTHGDLTTTVSTKSEVGSTWGLAGQRSTGLIWNSAVIRRHLPLGPRGIGGVYVHDRDGNLVASFDLEDLGLDLRPSASALGLNPTHFADSGGKVVFSDFNRDIRPDLFAYTGATGVQYGSRSYTKQSRDIPGFPAVGKAGLGDIDISDDSGYLWVTNLNTRTVHRFPILGGQTPSLGTPQQWAVDDGHTCAAGTGPLRPWGLDPQPDGSIIVAGVCTNESADPTTKPLPGRGVVLRIDPTSSGASAWNQLATVDFDYQHKYDYCTNHAVMTCTWKAWSDSWTAISTLGKNGSQYWWTQPMIVDVETLPDGSFALGINDRFSYQSGSSNFQPKDTVAYMEGYVAGGLRLLCKQGTQWVQEQSGDCAGDTTYDSSRTDSFFRNDFQGAHPATSIGSLAYGQGLLAYAAMDAAAYFTSGIRWVSASTGNQTNALTLSSEYGKASGLGDIEVLCDQAPLQIGNRVWYDLNSDGIQDPDEPPVVGVTVTLFDVSTSAVVGTAVTNDDGEYYFTSTNTEASTSASPDAFGGGLEADTPYLVKVADPDDCGTEAPLDGWDLTLQNGTTSAGSPTRDDLIDSDAVEAGSNACLYDEATVTVIPLSAGEVDHSYDIGFHVPSVFVGDLVWLDANGNGNLDPDESGVPGVVLSLTDDNGGSVTDLLGDPVDTVTTSATGYYRFPLLRLGKYRVTITVPEGYRLVSGFMQTSISVDLTQFGTWDRLRDFGLVASNGGGTTPTDPPPPPPPGGSTGGSVSVGDYVWFDTNRDGRQDDADVPLEGVVVRITTADGGSVTDVAGRQVSSTVTNADGWYAFDDLPYGQYRVTVEPPSGYVPTLAGVGSADGDSSTGFAVSRSLTVNADRDPTLDFGFVPVVSVGDYVWWDTNRDGRQDSTDRPIAGIVLTITTADGGPVFDAQGRPVTTTVTDANGRYSFDDLPPGQYKVTITAPLGARPTVASTADGERDSSTGFAISRLLTAGGDRDPTLDFGFVAVDQRLPSTGYDGDALWILAVMLLGAGVLVLLMATSAPRRARRRM